MNIEPKSGPEKKVPYLEINEAKETDYQAEREK